MLSLPCCSTISYSLILSRSDSCDDCTKKMRACQVFQCRFLLFTHEECDVSTATWARGTSTNRGFQPSDIAHDTPQRFAILRGAKLRSVRTRTVVAPAAVAPCTRFRNPIMMDGRRGKRGPPYHISSLRPLSHKVPLLSVCPSFVSVGYRHKLMENTIKSFCRERTLRIRWLIRIRLI